MNRTEICGQAGVNICNLPSAAKGKASMQLRENCLSIKVQIDKHQESSETVLPFSKINGVTININGQSFNEFSGKFSWILVCFVNLVFFPNLYRLYIVLMLLNAMNILKRQTWLTVSSNDQKYFIFFNQSEIIQYRQFAQTLLSKIK
ncbi:hypothetical protein [Lyngbya sp. PCC 8106]|uniref:hypothetical protein n=1 Tax=Lyngbya sp. (strain PCC 8106) TaxID=313612 RepID=UPI0000EA8CD3|nr:hypothetical protein [Lyngbya sp. PCC 8106]EAW36227.1 hypothetical protein L8106_22896 [Lyngbya sp. PCC 8106]